MLTSMLQWIGHFISSVNCPNQIYEFPENSKLIHDGRWLLVVGRFKAKLMHTVQIFTFECIRNVSNYFMVHRVFHAWGHFTVEALLVVSMHFCRCALTGCHAWQINRYWSALEINRNDFESEEDRLRKRRGTTSKAWGRKDKYWLCLLKIFDWNRTRSF